MSEKAGKSRLKCAEKPAILPISPGRHGGIAYAGLVYWLLQWLPKPRRRVRFPYPAPEAYGHPSGWPYVFSASAADRASALRSGSEAAWSARACRTIFAQIPIARTAASCYTSYKKRRTRQTREHARRASAPCRRSGDGAAACPASRGS